MMKMPKMKKKNGIIALLVLALSSAGALAYYFSAGIEVVLADVSSRDVLRLVEETGIVESKSAVAVIVKGGGTVSEIFVEEGQSVAQGDVLMSLSGSSSASEVASIQAQAAGVYSQYVVAKQIAENNKALYEQGAISYTEYATSLANAQQLSSQLASLGYSAESVVQATAVNGIESPIDGIVTVLYVKEGQMVDLGMPVAEIGGMDDHILSLHLISSDADLVSIGMKASVHAEGDFITDKAVVSKVALKATDYVSLLGIVQKRVSVEVRLPKQVLLRLGSNADVEIVVEERHGVLSIPSKAIFSIEDEEYVYVEQDGRAILTKVKIGLEGETYTEIEDGLLEGLRVVVSPSTDIGDGVRIKEKS